MKTFALVLQDISKEWRDDRVYSFIARDASGSFGLQANHETFVTCLQPGIAGFRGHDRQWCYLAQPGSVVIFIDNHLYLATTQFVMNCDREVLVQLLDTEWRAAEQEIRISKQSIARVEQALARKLWEMSQRSEGM